MILNSGSALKFLQVSCKGCSTEVGLFHALSSAVTLFKWQIISGNPTQDRSPSSIECLAATLLASISRSGSATSVIMPDEVSLASAKSSLGVESLHLWVLNSHLSYSSSSSNPRGSRLAMKVLYKQIDTEKALSMLDSLTSNIQEINLPLTAIREVLHTLHESNLMLPSTERQLKDWNVGLLNQWES